jgi:hypothetical protein
VDVSDIRIRFAGTCRTDAHPDLPDGPDDEGAPPPGIDLALRVEAQPDASLLAHVTLRAPAEVARSYRSFREAVALLVDVPSLGACASACLVERELQRQDPGPQWRGPQPASAFGAHTMTAWVSGEVRVLVDAPTTAYIRAAFRDRASEAVRVELSPPPPSDDDDE